MPPKAQKKPAEPAARSLDAKGCSGAGLYSVTGSTPLHEAAAAGHQGIVEALVAANADLAIQDCMGRMPLLFREPHHVAAGQNAIAQSHISWTVAHSQILLDQAESPRD
ncbi:TPA: hypothetical protein ACH3X3_000094 [Trebouxia sp. C0006]